MLALKKKREAQKKAQEEAEAKAALSGETSESPTEDKASEPKVKKISLIDGVGGKKKKSGEHGKQNGKRRTPGEIRIQKGEFI